MCKEDLLKKAEHDIWCYTGKQIDFNHVDLFLSGLTDWVQIIVKDILANLDAQVKELN